MQYLFFIIFTFFLIKSISYCIFEFKTNSNKVGATISLVISISGYIFAVYALYVSYGQAFLGGKLIV